MSCIISIQTGFTFLVLAYPGCPEKEDVVVVVVLSTLLLCMQFQCCSFYNLELCPDLSTSTDLDTFHHHLKTHISTWPSDPHNALLIALHIHILALQNQLSASH